MLLKSPYIDVGLESQSSLLVVVESYKDKPIQVGRSKIQIKC